MWLWIAAIVALVLLDIQVRWTSAASTAEAWDQITRTYGPFNIAGWLVILASLMPAIGANWLRKKLSNAPAQ